MSHSSYLAVVLEGGLVQTVIVEAWPSAEPLPRVIVVDYDTEGAEKDELTVFTIGTDRYEAYCHSIDPSVYETQDAALSPRKLLKGPDNAPDSPTPHSALVIARELRQRILSLDRELEDPERVTPEHYNHLYRLATRGLAGVLKALGEPTDFGV